jgi:hypothetical protein
MSYSSELINLDFSLEIDRLTEDFTGRQWVFDAVEEWVSKGSERFLIVTGEPGIGKSAIMARLAQTRDDVVAYHFCIAGRNSTITPNTVLRSIAAQLSRTVPEYGTALINSLKPEKLSIHVDIQAAKVDGGDITGVIIKHLYAADPEESLDILLRSPLCNVSETSPLIILIDSLDEAVTYQGRVNLASLLARIDDIPPWIKFICSSRPERRVLRYFDKLQPFILDAESENNLHDVGQYIAARVQRPAMQKSIKDTGMEKELSLEKLLARQCGNFLYIKILLDDIEAGRQSLANISDLPKSLDDIYHQFLSRFTFSEWKNQYQPLFRIFAAAQAPVTEEHLAWFTGIGKSDIRMRLGVLMQFLSLREIEQGQILYALYHQSLRDYLIDGGRNDDFWCPPEEGHLQIAQHFLRVSGGNDWQGIDDYGLKFLPLHLSSCGELECFEKVATSYNYLRAFIVRFGISDLLSLLQDVLARISADTDILQKIKNINGLMLQEGFALSKWDQHRSPAYLYSQLKNAECMAGLQGSIIYEEEHLLRCSHSILEWQWSAAEVVKVKRFFPMPGVRHGGIVDIYDAGWSSARTKVYLDPDCKRMFSVTTSRWLYSTHSCRAHYEKREWDLSSGICLKVHPEEVVEDGGEYDKTPSGYMEPNCLDFVDSEKFKKAVLAVLPEHDKQKDGFFVRILAISANSRHVVFYRSWLIDSNSGLHDYDKNFLVCNLANGEVYDTSILSSGWELQAVFQSEDELVALASEHSQDMVLFPLSKRRANKGESLEEVSEVAVDLHHNLVAFLRGETIEVRTISDGNILYNIDLHESGDDSVYWKPRSKILAFSADSSSLVNCYGKTWIRWLFNSPGKEIE